MTDPIRIISKAKNNRLMEIREELKMTAREFSSYLGIGYQTYLAIESLRRYPTKHADRIAERLERPKEWLFPEYLRVLARTSARHTIPENRLFSLQSNEVKGFLVGDASEETERVILLRELAISLSKSFSAILTEREQAVLEMRFGLNGEPTHYLHQVADRLGVTVERVRQIEWKAIRKLGRSEELQRLDEDL